MSKNELNDNDTVASHGGRIGELIERALGRVALASHRQPFVALLLVLLVTLGAWRLASNLKLDSDLTELLPQSFRSVKDIEVLKQRFGGVGYVVVVGRGADADALRRFADDIAPKLATLPTVRYVDYQRPVAFFEDRALYFLDVEDLATVDTTLRSRAEWEKRNRNPLYLDLEDSEPPSLELKELRDKYAGRSDRKWLKTQLGEQYYLDPDKKIVALLVKPSKMSIDLAFAREVVGDVERVVAGIDPKAYGPNFNIALTGRYKKRVDQQDLIQRDLTIASTVATLLVLGYLVIHFRRFLALLLIMAPLLIGLLWTFAFADLAFGTLNILTGFIGAILTGLGIDHGIHLLGRYEAERASGVGEEDAVRRTFGDTARAVLIAGLTTTVGFAGLGLSEFRAFREFGVIAAGGMLLIVTSYTVLLPTLLSLATRAGWKPSTHVTARSSGFAAGLPRWAGRLALGSAILIVLGTLNMRNGSFDYDFSALEASNLLSFQLDEETNQLLGYSQTPVVILADTLDEERDVARALRERVATFGEASTVDFVAASTDLIPTEQAQKHAILQSLHTTLSEIKPSWLKSDLRQQLQLGMRMTDVAPFGRDEIPLTVRRQFYGPNGSMDAGFVLVFPGISLSDGDRVGDFAREVRGIELPGGKTVSAAGEPMILADIIEMVATEAPPVLLLTLVLVFFTLWILLGRLSDAVLSLTPALLTLTVTLGILPLVGVSLNYLNIVMIPVLFGISVDGGAHIVTRLRSGQQLHDVLSETGRAISGSLLTTGFGFGALMLAHHRGLDSLGSLAVIGLAVNVLACLVVLPAFLVWRAQWRAARLTAREPVQS